MLIHIIKEKKHLQTKTVPILRPSVPGEPPGIGALFQYGCETFCEEPRD